MRLCANQCMHRHQASNVGPAHALSMCTDPGVPLKVQVREQNRAAAADAAARKERQKKAAEEKRRAAETRRKVETVCYRE